MTKNKQVDAEALIKEAENAEHKEAYKPLERNKAFRIGVVARADATNHPSFFIEIIISLAPDICEVDLPHLEKTLECLKALHARRYSLTYQDDNCISCETEVSAHKIAEEYAAAKALMQTL